MPLESSSRARLSASLLNVGQEALHGAGLDSLVTPGGSKQIEAGSYTLDLEASEAPDGGFGLKSDIKWAKQVEGRYVVWA